MWRAALLAVLLAIACGHALGRRRSAPVAARPVWNASQLPENEEARRVLMAVVARPWTGSGANITDDFRLSWRLAANSSAFSAAGANDGVAVMHLRAQEETTLQRVGAKVVTGDVVVHRGRYPSEHSTQWLLQAIFFVRDQTLVGLLHQAGVGTLENVRVELPVNASAVSLVAQVARLGANLSSPGWLPYDELHPTGSSLFYARRQKPCYFVMAMRLGSSGEYAQPEWRRAGQPAGKGRASPFVNAAGTLFSPNCEGLVVNLEGKSLFFLELIQHGRSYAVAMLVLGAALNLSMFRQMRRSESSVNAARVSSVSFGMMLLLDAYLLTLHFLSAMLLSGSIAFGMLAFVQFVSFTFFHLRLFLTIWRADTLVARFISTRTSHFRLYMWGLGLFMVFVNFPVVWFVFLLLFMGFWVPQIVVNVIRNASRQLDWNYIFWGTAARLAPLLYFCFSEANFLQIRPSPKLGWAVLVFVAVQLSVLALQDTLGPRWCVPFFFPPPYDFGRPIDALHVGECVICLGGISEDMIVRKEYMVAPCNHVFHRACLEKWMEEKLQCPTCRTALPAD